jgi:hypothetical protein
MLQFPEMFLQNLELRNWKGISAANSLFFWKSVIKLLRGKINKWRNFNIDFSSGADFHQFSKFAQILTEHDQLKLYPFCNDC